MSAERTNTRVPPRGTPQDPGGRSLTKQSLAAGLETAEIAAKYIQTGCLDSWNRREPRYGDFSSVPEYRECLDRVLAAQEAFDELPAEVRDRCKNDPAELLAMVFDPTRQEELRSLGLVPAGEAPPPLPGSSDDGEPPAPGEA